MTDNLPKLRVDAIGAIESAQEFTQACTLSPGRSPGRQSQKPSWCGYAQIGLPALAPRRACASGAARREYHNQNQNQSRHWHQRSPHPV